MLYCDKCADEHGYDITTEKEKGECELCHRRLGSMNVMHEEGVEGIVNNIQKEEINVAGIKIKQIIGFVPGTALGNIEPGSPHRFLTDKKVLFHKSDSLIVADIQTGKRVEIRF